MSPPAERVSATSRWLAAAAAFLVAATGFALAMRRIEPGFRARNKVETVLLGFLIGASMIAILTTVGIVISVLSEALAFFELVPLTDFLFGTSWSPQTAIRADQAGASGSFGILPLLVGTLLITTIAMLVATPIGLMSAIYLAEYATPRLRAFLKPLLEVLADFWHNHFNVYGPDSWAAPIWSHWDRSVIRGNALGNLVAAAAAGVAGNFVLKAHCAIPGTSHELLGHASVALVFVVTGSLEGVEGPLAPAREGLRAPEGARVERFTPFAKFAHIAQHQPGFSICAG